MGWIGGIVLDVDLRSGSEPLGKPIGLDQRGHARFKWVSSLAIERQEVCVAPDPPGPSLDTTPGFLRVQARVVVPDFQRPEALITEKVRTEFIFG